MMLSYFATSLSGCEPPGLKEWDLGGLDCVEGDCLLGLPELCMLEGAFLVQQCICLLSSHNKAASGPDASLDLRSSLGCF